MWEPFEIARVGLTAMCAAAPLLTGSASCSLIVPSEQSARVLPRYSCKRSFSSELPCSRLLPGNLLLSAVPALKIIFQGGPRLLAVASTREPPGSVFISLRSGFLLWVEACASSLSATSCHCGQARPTVSKTGFGCEPAVLCTPTLPANNAANCICEQLSLHKQQNFRADVKGPWATFGP